MVPVSRCFSPQTRQEWLAVFRSPEFFRTYWLPRHFKEQVIVTRHFYLKPLLPFLTDDGHFFILAFSHNHIRLLEGTHDSVSEVAVPEAVPHSQASAMTISWTWSQPGRCFMGSVYAVEHTNMPDEGLLAAAFRY